MPTTSSRVKDLEAQVKHLRRSQEAASASTETALSSQFSVRPPTSLPSTVLLPTSSALLSTPATGYETATSKETPWLQVSETPTQPIFTYRDCVLTYFDVLDLFKHFEDIYYPFFAVLEPVTSLTKLAEESQLLFWTIICVATRQYVLCTPPSNTLAAFGAAAYPIVSLQQSLSPLPEVCRRETCIRESVCQRLLRCLAERFRSASSIVDMHLALSSRRPTPRSELYATRNGDKCGSPNWTRQDQR